MLLANKSLLHRFQSTLPQGERRSPVLTLLGMSYFNPRSHKGSDCRRPKLRLAPSISIHAPTRGATFLVLDYIYLMIFQSTLPQGERRRIKSAVGTKFYFNPRSHKGSDRIKDKDEWIITISIHAPTRGATVLFCFLSPFVTISIHAPTRGATDQGIQSSRSRNISIHAPTRGATEIFFSLLIVS